MPPDSSPPTSTSPSTILDAIYLNPIDVVWTTLLVQVFDQESQEQMRAHELTVLIVHPDSVRVTVVRNADGAFLADHHTGQLLKVALDGLRRLTSESRVQIRSEQERYRIFRWFDPRQDNAGLPGS